MKTYNLCIEGNELLCKGKYSEALKKYDAAIKLDPKNVTLLYNRAKTKFLLGLHRACVKDTTQCLQLDPNCTRAIILKVKSNLKLGKTKEAINEAKSFLSKCYDVDAYQTLTQLIHGEKLEEEEPVIVVPTQTKSLKKEVEQQTPLKQEEQRALIMAEKSPVGELGGRKITEQDIMLAAAHNMIQGGSGNPQVDVGIALGYFLVNTGQLDAAVKHFNEFIKNHKTIVAGYLGRGTAYALLGKLDESILDFSQAITLDPLNHEPWIRRGQARVAKGYIADAMKDFNHTIKLRPELPDGYFHRGVLLHNSNEYRSAIKDFEKVIELNPKDPKAWNHLGACRLSIGHCLQAIKAFEKATSLDSNYVEAWANMGNAYKSWGDYNKAEAYLSKALNLDPKNFNTYNLRYFARYGAGKIQMALRDCKEAKKLNPSSKETRGFLAMCYFTLGQYSDALAEYDELVQLDPKHHGFYQREMVIYMQTNIDRELKSMSLDAEIDPYFKEALCKRADPATLKDYVPLVRLKNPPPNVDLNPVLTETEATLINITKPFGKRLQLKTPGFLENIRQHRMAGFAVLEMAQAIVKYWKDPKGFIMDGRCSSRRRTPHIFYYRDFFDIAVKWRQLSEPNDPVWWIDQISPETYEEGFGLQTPMYSGQMEVPRYYPYYHKGLEATKRLILDQWALTDEMQENVKKAKSCEEVHTAMGRDFWVVTYCTSTEKKGEHLEGTRLTIVKTREGYDFTIRTPATPKRYKQFEQELTWLWDRLTEEATKPDRDLDKLSDLILRIYFYWVNFAPITRGTAAIGLIAMMALFLAIDIEVSSVCQEGVQLDFESIIGGDVEEFVSMVKKWLYPLRTKTDLMSKAPDVQSTITTPRKLIAILNAK